MEFFSYFRARVLYLMFLRHVSRHTFPGTFHSILSYQRNERWLVVLKKKKKRSIWKNIWVLVHYSVRGARGWGGLSLEGTGLWAELVVSKQLHPDSDVSLVSPLPGKLFYYILFALLPVPCERMDSLRQFIPESFLVTHGISVWRSGRSNVALQGEQQLACF